MSCSEIEPEAEDVCRFCQQCLSIWPKERRLLHIESCVERVIRNVCICPSCSKKLNPNVAKNHLLKCASTLGLTLTNFLFFCEQPKKPPRKPKRVPDEDLSRAIALSRSTLEPVDKVKVSNPKCSKTALVASEHLLIDPITRFRIFSDRLSLLLQKSSGRGQSISRKKLNGVSERFLWNLSSKELTNSTLKQPNFDFYVSTLVPPLSPSGNKFGANLLRLSQIPGRSHSFCISNSQEVESVTQPLTSLESSCSNQPKILADTSEATPIRSLSSANNSTFFSQPLSPLPIMSTPPTTDTHHNIVEERIVPMTDFFVRMVDNPVCSDLSICLDNGDTISAHRFILASWNPNLAILREDTINAPGISKMQLLNLLTALYSVDQKALSSLDPEVEFVLDCWQLLDSIRLRLRINCSSKVDIKSPPKTRTLINLVDDNDKYDDKVEPKDNEAFAYNNEFSSSQPPSELHQPTRVSHIFSTSPAGGVSSADLFADTSSILIPDSPPAKPPTIESTIVEMNGMDDIPIITSTVRESTHITEDLTVPTHSQLCSLEPSPPSIFNEGLPEVNTDIPMSSFPDFDRMPSPPPVDAFFFPDSSPEPLAKRIRLSNDSEDTIDAKTFRPWSSPLALSPSASGTSSIERPICLEDMEVPIPSRSKSAKLRRWSSLKTKLSKPVNTSGYYNPDGDTDDEYIDVDTNDTNEVEKEEDDLPKHHSSAPSSPIRRSSSLTMSQVFGVIGAEGEEEPVELASSQPVFITPMARRLSTNVNINSPITPKPSYEHMTLTELQKCLSIYGVRHLPKKKAVLLLNHIYDELHPYVEIPTPIRPPLRTTSSTSLPLPSNPPLFRGPSLNDSDDDDDESTERASSTGQSSLDSGPIDMKARKANEKETQLVQLQQKVYQYLQGDENIYYNIVTYTPIDLDCIHALLRCANIKIGQKQLMTWLDEWGVTYTTKNKRPVKPKQMSTTGW